MTAAAPLGVVTFYSPILRGRPALVHRGPRTVDGLALAPAGNGWVIRDRMPLRPRALLAQTRGATARY